MKTEFLPEGRLLETAENQTTCATRLGLINAMTENRILEGIAHLCSADHSLIVRVGPFTGVIPRDETAIGIAEGTTREIAILSRVGKPICFVVDSLEGPDDSPTLLLSRRRAQQMALQHIFETWQQGQIIPATVTHLESFGAFVDIGCGLVSMIGIENLSVSRIPHPGCRLTPGQHIFALVTGFDYDLNRVHLSHKELLGTWSENASRIAPGMAVTGYIRSIMDYGAFVELFPNLSGLAEPKEGLKEGERVSVYIKSIFPERRKIKLRILDRLPHEAVPPPIHYFHHEGILFSWLYL